MKQLTFEETFGVNSFDPGENETNRLSTWLRHFLGKIGSSPLFPGNRLIGGRPFDPVVSETMTDKVDEYAVSPDGSLSVYAIRGDLFVTANDKEDDRVRLTRSSARERDAIWLSSTPSIRIRRDARMISISSNQPTRKKSLQDPQNKNQTPYGNAPRNSSLFSPLMANA